MSSQFIQVYLTASIVLFIITLILSIVVYMTSVGWGWVNFRDVLSFVGFVGALVGILGVAITAPEPIEKLLIGTILCGAAYFFHKLR